ncbi:general secretion pathway protein GspK [uncultured Oceanisphaera sp.]|uniref:general secretion pathway protein GspK n=1 Tax=uncultured Oceanisphaera sp. TaxID=353858 RepID=UPI00260A0589|nr:type II secretion system protein GspK [uncultured Oceanisphaera sp.]
MSIRQNRGLALISVLWVLTLLTLLATGLSLNSRSQAQQSSNITHAAQVRQAAEAGVQMALLMLAQPLDQQTWLADGSPYQVRLDDIEVRVALFNESGRIDLNAAGPELLDGLLATAGVDEDLRARLVDAIMDWRDGDSLRRLNGAEADDYLAAGLDYGPSNTPFRSVDEVLRVLGMPPDIYRRIRHSLTLRNPRNSINPRYAPRQVLLALPGSDELTVDQFIADRRRSHEEGHPLPAINMFPRALLSGGSSGVNYTVHTEARMNTVYRYRLTASLRNRRGRPILEQITQEFIPLFTEPDA